MIDPGYTYNETLELRFYLSNQSTNSWEYDAIDCCYTDKDADLTECGARGVEVVEVERVESTKGFTINLVAHLLWTHPSDVSLNVSETETADYDELLEAYLEQAEEVVCGEWMGDEWVHEEEIPFTSVLVMDEQTGEIDMPATALLIREEFNKAVADIVKGECLTHKLLNMLAGWCTPTGTPIAEGEPAPFAAWNTANAE